MKDPILSPVKNRRVANLIEEQLKELIFSQQIPEGGRIPTERKLAKIFDASRLSVREALRMLESKGLIEIRKGAQGGGYVRKISSEPVIESLNNMINLQNLDINKIAEARLAIEPNICKIAAMKASDQDIEYLNEFNEKLRESFTTGDSSIENDPHLHAAIADIAGNEILKVIIEALVQIHAYNMKGIKLDKKAKSEILQYHMDIISAIKAKDQDKAHDTMANHIENVRKHLSRLGK